MNKKVFLTAVVAVIMACNAPKENKESAPASMIGTWQLISATTVVGDSIHQDDLTGKRMIKILNETHFAFLNHDVDKEKDSLNFYVAGGGRYTLTDNHYTEYLEYLNYRAWEGNTFEFTIEIKGDTLIQKGIEKIEDLGVDREITEVYLKTVD